MEKTQYDSPMLRQARAIPDLIRSQYEDLEPKTRKIFATPLIFSFKKIILTGCGDSYAACLAVKSAFEDFVRIPVEVPATLDLSRHYPETRLNDGPHSPLVIAVSHSGEVARVVESIMRADRATAFTLGVTKNTGSSLGRNARAVLPLNPPEFEPSPGVGSYCISLMALLLLAIRLGEVRQNYTMDEANRYRQSLLRAADRMEERMTSLEEEVFGIAERWKGFSGFDFVGSGADYGSVFFGQAKILEAAGMYAMHTNTEEWLHLNFFLRNAEQTGTVLIADSKNAALSRVREVAAYMKMNNRPLLILSDTPLLGREEKVCCQIRLPETAHISFSSLLQLIPLSMLAGFLSSLRGEIYGRGLTGNWAFSKGAKAVRESEMHIL